MLFGGMEGIISFYPDSVLYRSNFATEIPLWITGFEAFGDSVIKIPDIFATHTLVLPKGTNTVKISFACLDYRNSDKILYRYRLDSTNQWINTDYRHLFVTYAGIKSGKYIFQVQETDIIGNFANRQALEIFIPPYFLQTIWFTMLVNCLVLLAISILFFIYRRQTSLKEQRKTIHLRLDFLRNQLNPHFLFNSLDSINYFIPTLDQISVNQFITGFSRLMRAILTNSASEYIPMESELVALEDYCKLEHLRFGDKFDYHIDVDDRINLAGTEIILTMFQPFVGNAIWHGVRCLEGRKWYVTIEFVPGSTDHITCKISDDGIGRKESVKMMRFCPGKR